MRLRKSLLLVCASLGVFFALLACVPTGVGVLLLAAQGAKQTVMVPMSDGVKLATDVYLPQGAGPFPAVLMRTPYGRSDMGQNILAGLGARSGCTYVVQDMRGRFDSEGENLPFVACGWGEHRDGADTVAWILKQPWSGGKVGTMGGSALGITQNLLAGAVPPGLAAQYIQVAPASMYHHAVYVGGALRKEQVENWTRSNRFDPKALEIMLAHPCYDDYWHGQDSTLKHPVMNVPAVHVGGWFDTFSQGTIDSFVGRQHGGAEGARGKQKLVMGPWTHGGSGREGVGERVFPDARMPGGYQAARWFEYHLKGVDNGAMKQPAVAYYVMGDTSDPKAPGNQWRYAADWPVPAKDTPYYFAKGGGLTAVAPAAAEAVAEYTFDPADPCPTIGGKNLTILKGPCNQNRIETRKDVLLFTTEPLGAPVEVTGRVRAKVFLASSAADTDLSVRLCDVYPDGKSFEMAEGMLRLRCRRSLEKPEPLVPGQVAEVTVDCWSTSIVFNTGHRIRAIVTSSNYPRFDLNPGTGKPWSDGGEKVRQTNRISCDAARPSCIVLPVVSAGEPPAGDFKSFEVRR
ncbi:MAG: CocE/NonD family hydrolase [Planctomycetes bacterium]|nr:CocE/NonD family hydrolase [Planctomycetota bacterium]